MATMVADFVERLGSKCVVVLDAYFAVGPVFSVLREVVDDNSERLVHIVTRAKSNIVAYNPYSGLKLNKAVMSPSYNKRFCDYMCSNNFIFTYLLRREIVQELPIILQCLMEVQRIS